MKNKKGLRYKLTVYIALILLISNTLFIGLLFHNYYVMSKGVEVEINGAIEVFFYYDHFEAKLLFAGVIIAICSTSIGTFLSYFLLGKLLKPLNKLTNHMQNVNSRNLTDKIDIHSDILEVDSLINSFNFMNEKLKAKMDSQENFSHYIAHELRSPLAVMLMNAGMAKKYPDKDFGKVLDTFEDQTLKMESLIKQILDITGVNRVELKDEIDMNLLIEEVVLDLEEKANTKNVKLDFNYDENSNGDLKTNTLIPGSYKLLYQAFFNLVENSIKYNYENGLVIVRIKDGGEYLIVNIKDTGIGIDYKEKDKIFYPHYRSKNNKNQNIDGNGIGLAFVKEIIEHHKGSIELLDSDKGTEFEVYLRKKL